MKRGLPGLNPKTAFAKARVNLPNEVETIWQPFYDYQTKTAAATNSQTFFQDPIGSAGRGLADTNMELSGQIPKGQAFAITGVQVELYPTADITSGGESEFAQDVYDFYSTGVLILRIGAKEYIRQGNLMKFAPVNRVGGFSGAGANVNNVYAQAAGREFEVRDLLLESNQNFSIELRDLSAISANARLGVTLNGYLMRNAQ